MPIEQGDKPKATPFGHGKQTGDNPSVIGQGSQSNQGNTKKHGSSDPTSPGKQTSTTGKPNQPDMDLAGNDANSAE